MKKKILIFPIISAMLFTICLSGCDKTPEPTVPNDTSVESTNPSDTTPSTDIDEPIADTSIAAGSQFVWDKEYQTLNAKDIQVDKNWSSYITIGGNKIMSNQMTDASVLNNYFYDENKLSVIDDMKMAYELDWRDFYVKTETIAPNELANGELVVTASSHPSEAKFLDTYKHNLIAHTIQYNGYAAELEEIVNALKEIKVDGEGVWGIGSTYEDVMSIMGEPTNEYSEDAFEHSMFTTVIYANEQCTLSITFFTDTVASKGFVIGMTWGADSVINELYTQEGYADFFSGLYSEMDFSEMSENTNTEDTPEESEDTSTDENSDSTTNDVTVE